MKSKLVKDLDINSQKELEKLIDGLSVTSKIAARKTILHGESYSSVANHLKISKPAVYDLLKRLYKRKFGKDYGKEIINT